MRLLILGALLPLFVMGDKGTDYFVREHNVGPIPVGPTLPGEDKVEFHKGEEFYLPANDENCDKDLYKPEFQLPLPQIYKVVYNDKNYSRRATTTEAFIKDFKMDEGWLRNFMIQKQFKDLVAEGMEQKMIKEFQEIFKETDKEMAKELLEKIHNEIIVKPDNEKVNENVKEMVKEILENSHNEYIEKLDKEMIEKMNFIISEVIREEMVEEIDGEMDKEKNENMIAPTEEVSESEEMEMNKMFKEMFERIKTNFKKMVEEKMGEKEVKEMLDEENQEKVKKRFKELIKSKIIDKEFAKGLGKKDDEELKKILIKTIKGKMSEKKVEKILDKKAEKVKEIYKEMVKEESIKEIIEKIIQEKGEKIGKEKLKEIFRKKGEEMVEDEWRKYEKLKYPRNVKTQNEYEDQMKERRNMVTKILKTYTNSEMSEERYCTTRLEKPNGKEGCVIDDSDEEYAPRPVIGQHLATGYLPASFWPKPDKDNISVYKNLWHSNKHENVYIKKMVDRCSFAGKYEILKSGHPLNPYARTGLTLRGELYQWGPVRGIGAILWLVNEHGQFEFLAIKNGKYERKEDQKYTTPGGYIDPEEDFEVAARRELIEEALGTKEKYDKKLFEEKKKLIGKGEVVLFGYDDAKENNTDNAWNESATYAFQIGYEQLKDFKPKAKSDAVKSMWFTIFTNKVAKDSENRKESFEDLKVALKGEQNKEEKNIEESLGQIKTLHEKIEFILGNFSVCWELEGDEAKNHRCREMKDPKMLNMEKLARKRYVSENAKIVSEITSNLGEQHDGQHPKNLDDKREQSEETQPIGNIGKKRTHEGGSASPHEHREGGPPPKNGGSDSKRGKIVSHRSASPTKRESGDDSKSQGSYKSGGRSPDHHSGGGSQGHPGKKGHR
uniref:Nudix hydrolase domain-containing protein n=1 Tax=Meloidogyne hapla TaxID=6305 RepID=A0A1I8BVT0_MELHA